jgi:rod shape-determining protein MreD
MNIVVKNIIRFVLIVAFQVLVLNDSLLRNSTALSNIVLFKPFMYILFLLMLPININKNLLLVIAVVTGLIVDAFSNTYGLHACAALVVAFVRPALIRAFTNISPKDYSKAITPSISTIGFGRFFSYAGLSCLAFALYYYFLGELIIKPGSHYFVNVGISAFLTLILLICSQIFFITTGRRR